MDTGDPGDETQRNFRYQHAYGVILLVQASLGTSPYVAVWCEQHEDFLCERADDRFDGWQVKTRKPELGPWTLSDEPLTATLGRFCDLVGEFDAHIVDLYFVSNVAVDTVTAASHDDKRRARCPQLFLDHLNSCATHADLKAPYQNTFNDLQAETGADAELLFATLRRVHIVQGPERRDFEAVVAMHHVGHLPFVSGWPIDRVGRFRDELIRVVAEASALRIHDGRRDVHPIRGRDCSDPRLLGKRILVSSLPGYVPADSATPTFRTQRTATLQLTTDRAPNAGARLRQKLLRGGLDSDQVEDFETLGRSAEYHLLREANRRPEEYRSLQADVEAAVLHEYRRAHLRAKRSGSPFGETLMIDLQDRLARLAVEKPDEVWRQSEKCLLGVAALLTDDCRMWFSERFVVSQDGEPVIHAGQGYITTGASDRGVTP